MNKRSADMKLIPQNDWAVIRPTLPEKKTAGGIIIPDTAAEKPLEGVVEAIGPGAYEEEKTDEKTKKEKKERKFVPTTVKPGQRVLYQKYSGQSFKTGGEEVILVRERDILGIVSDS
jgi:chaperonin GroES